MPLPAGLAGGAGPLFVGRLAELAEFERVWAWVCDDSRQVVFLGGEPGVGKTRLAREVAATLHEHGAAVLWGVCHPDLDVPYQPVVTALEGLLEAAEPGSLRSVLGESAGELPRLTDKVRRHLPDLEVTAPGERDARLALFDAVRDLLVALARRQPVVLVLEDLHWASTPTLQLITRLVQSTAQVSLLVVATHRTTAPDRSDELTRTIADLYRHDGVARLDLEGLETEDVVEYLVLEGGLDAAEARLAAVVLRDQTAGNPFFVHELWRELSAAGGIEALRSAVFAAPQTVRDTLERRLSDLAGPHVEVVELAAVAGEAFDLPILLEAADQGREVVLEAVDRGVDFGLFVTDPEVAGRHRFRHALIRQAVLDRLPPSRRSSRHARIGEALERQGGDDPAVVARLAHHYEQAHALGHRERAVDYLTAAAAHARRSLAYEEAASLYTRAADLAAGDPSRRSELLLAAADSRFATGDFAEARRVFEQLAQDADPDVALQAAIGYEDASFSPSLPGDRAVELLEQALRRRTVGVDDPTSVWALASLGRALTFTGAVRAAEQVGERAIALARQVGDADLLTHALCMTLWQGMTPRQVPVLVSRTEELLALGRHRPVGRPYYADPIHRALFGYMQGDPDMWAVGREDMRRAAREWAWALDRYLAACVQYAHQFATGDLGGARRTLATLQQADAEFGVDSTEGSHGIQVFMLKRATTALEQVRPLMTGEEDLEGHWVPGLLALYVELGLREPASRVLHHLLERLEGYRVSSSTWGGVLAFLVDAAVRLADEPAAAVLRPELAEYRGMNLVAGQFVAVFGSADRELARIDSLLGQPSADLHFEAALDMDRRMGATTHEVETLTAWSRHLARRGDPTARTRATRLAAEARTLAERIGHHRALRDLGADPAPQPARELPDELTEREVEVLQLVAEGLANREIGERLFISANTAANHVRSILTKTGAANRTQAAIYAAEHGLLADRRERAARTT